MTNTSNGLSITQRIVLMQVIVVFVVTMVVGAASYRVMVSHFKSVQESELKASAKAVASLVNNDLDSLRNTVEHIAKTEAVVKYHKSFNE